jgi:hypothetical protein
LVEPALVEQVAEEGEVAPVYSEEFRMVPQSDEAAPVAEVATAERTESGVASTVQHPRRSLVRKMRDWLLRAA